MARYYHSRLDTIREAASRWMFNKELSPKRFKKAVCSLLINCTIYGATVAVLLLIWCAVFLWR